MSRNMCPSAEFDQIVLIWVCQSFENCIRNLCQHCSDKKPSLYYLSTSLASCPSTYSLATCLEQPSSTLLHLPILQTSCPCSFASDSQAAYCVCSTVSEIASCRSCVGRDSQQRQRSHHSLWRDPKWACACPLKRWQLTRQCDQVGVGQYPRRQNAMFANRPGVSDEVKESSGQTD